MIEMKYLSVCSGIEAASVAWHPLGWSPVAFSEIEKFPCAVLKSHYPNVPNWGDMTKYQEWPDADVDLLVGGTPCQSFSVAGLRGGLADPRGNLALTYLGIVDRYRPEWMVWENVPGVLSSGAGRDFGSFLGGLAELGYGFAYRVLDAQFIRVDGFGRAVPQRRRRVFVVGNSRSWRRAAAVLFEPESLSGNSPPSRKAGKGVADDAARCTARSSGHGGYEETSAGGSVRATGGDVHGGSETIVAEAFGGGNQSGSIDVAAGLNAKSAQRQDFESETFLVAPPIARTLTCGAESGGKYAGRRQEDDDNLVATPFNITPSNSNKDFNAREADYAQALTSDGGQPSARGGDVIAIQESAHIENTKAGPQGKGWSDDGSAFTLEARHRTQSVQQGWRVRRLTPLECERLQGFPDGYSDVVYNRKNRTPDGPRYKALGNSMAVNSMRWLGRRIDMIRSLDVS